MTNPSPMTGSVTRAAQHYAGRRVLVTGGTGFMGGRLADALEAGGAEVHVTSLPNQPTGPHDAHQVDLRDEAGTRALIAALRPELVFHLAGLVDTTPGPQMVAPTLANNLVATVNVLLGALDAGARRTLVTGSSEELTSEAGHPTSPYAASKSALAPYCDLFRESYGLDLALLRPFMAYGPGQAPHRLVPSVTLQLLAGDSPLLRDPERVCDLVHVDDVVTGFLVAGAHEGALTGVYDLGTGTGTALRQVIETVRGFIADAPEARYADVPASVGPHVAFARGGRLPGWSAAIPLAEGLEQTVAWYRDHPSTTKETT